MDLSAIRYPTSMHSVRVSELLRSSRPLWMKPVVFGIRNFQNAEAGIAEAFRTLRSGGCYMVMEFTTPRGKIFGALYRFYSKHIMPRVGALVSKDRSAYTYLPESIPEFANSGFEQKLTDAGFRVERLRPQMRGIATIFVARKPN